MLDISADTLDFGNVEVDSSAVMVLTIYSLGEDTAVVSIPPPGDGVFFDWMEIYRHSLNPGDSLSIEVYFTPVFTGFHAAVLYVFYQFGFREVTLLGNGVPLSAPFEPDHPRVFGIISAAPNPFNKQLQLEFSLEHQGEVSLSIHDAQGRLVRELNHGFRSAGVHRFGLNHEGLSTGIYWIYLKQGSNRDVKKIIYLR